MVKSFLEREEEENCGVDEESEPKRSDPSEGNCDDDSELRETLRGLLGCGDDAVKRNICYETEKACVVSGDGLEAGLKRRLMARLRERGFDAGELPYGPYPSLSLSNWKILLPTLANIF